MDMKEKMEKVKIAKKMGKDGKNNEFISEIKVP